MQSKMAVGAATTVPRMWSHTIQPVILALGDVAEAKHEKKKLSQEEYESRLTITEGAQKRRSATGERQVNPWEERNRLRLDWGPLDKIGVTEPLRIYGHGQGYNDEREVSMVGGYTPEKLTTKLIELGLPSQYKGEIYLTGCDTAVGRNYGFLAKFYFLIKEHCPGVTVRGNLGVATSLPSGEQGIWTGAIGKREYDSLRRALNDKNEELLERSRQLRNKSQLMVKKAFELKQEGLKWLSQTTPDKQQGDDIIRRQELHVLRGGKVDDRMSKVAEQIREVADSIAELDAIAYDSSGKLSVKLPISDSELQQEKEDIRKARLKAKLRNIWREVREDLGEDLTRLYGWSPSHFRDLERQGEFKELIEARVRSRLEPVPSYFA